MIERIARALCEQHIRNVRRHDTEPERLEAMLPASVDHAWPDFKDAAQAVLTELSAGDGVQQVGRQLVIDLLEFDSETAEQFRNGLCFTAEAEMAARHRTLAAAAERARIVAWLRGHEAFSHIGGKFMADAIEAGEV